MRDERPCLALRGRNPGGDEEILQFGAVAAQSIARPPAADDQPLGHAPRAANLTTRARARAAPASARARCDRTRVPRSRRSRGRGGASPLCCGVARQRHARPDVADDRPPRALARRSGLPRDGAREARAGSWCEANLVSCFRSTSRCEPATRPVRSSPASPRATCREAVSPLRRRAGPEYRAWYRSRRAAAARSRPGRTRCGRLLASRPGSRPHSSRSARRGACLRLDSPPGTRLSMHRTPERSGWRHRLTRRPAADGRGERR